MSETEKKKNADETLNIIEKILDCNKMFKKFFSLHHKFIKENQN